MDMLRRGVARVASLGSSDDFIGRDVQVGTAVVRIRSVIAEGECRRFSLQIVHVILWKTCV